MREKGRVMAIKDGRARVEIAAVRLSCCSRCGLCSAQGGNIMIMEAAAPPGLKAGDRVTIEIPERSTLAAALLLLFAPLVLLFGGTLLGYKLIPGQGEVNVPALLVGAALMVAWYVGVHFVDKKRARSSPNPPRIVEIGPEAPPSRTGGTSAGEGEEDAKNPPDSWM